MQYCCFASTSPILTLSHRLKRGFFRIAPPAPAKTVAFDPNPTQIRTAPPRRSFRSKRQWLHRRHRSKQWIDEKTYFFLNFELITWMIFRQVGNSDSFCRMMIWNCENIGVIAQAFEDAWKTACSSKGKTRVLVPENYTCLVRPIDLSGPCKARLTLQVFKQYLSLYFHSFKYMSLIILCVLFYTNYRSLVQSLLLMTLMLGKV